MTHAQTTAAAIFRCKGQPSLEVCNSRGLRIGRVCRNRYGLWESFHGASHVTGSHLEARDAIAALQEHHRSLDAHQVAAALASH